MKIHEYQGKELLRKAGVPVPRGYPAFTVHEAGEAAQKLGGPVWVVKAQIHAGGPSPVWNFQSSTGYAIVQSAENRSARDGEVRFRRGCRARSCARGGPCGLSAAACAFSAFAA